MPLEGPDPPRGPHQGGEQGHPGQLLQRPRTRQLRARFIKGFPPGESRSCSGKDPPRHSGGKAQLPRIGGSNDSVFEEMSL